MVRKDDGSCREKLFAMWQRIFHDTRPYTEFYFDEIYGDNEVFLEEDNGKLRGMLHLNPYLLQLGEDIVTAHYIVGVSTEEEFRRQGVMRRMLLETFRELRSRGEAFTYLMPADENYYLPFGFRFGMEQFEQEIEPVQLPLEERGYTFLTSAQADPGEYVDLENEYKSGRYGMYTRVTEEYLRKLEREVRSEFGCLFYVQKGGKPLGRFVIYGEDDSMSVSRITCYDMELREEFLQQIIRFLDGRYHFRRYRITFPEDWESDLFTRMQDGSVRVFRSRKNKVIMFRILDLEEMGRWLKTEIPVSCVLQVTDEQIPQQQGRYRFAGDEQGMNIRRIPDTEDILPDGIIDIGSLTGRIFGNLSENEMTMPESFQENAKTFWKSLKSIYPVEISEIV